jgi:iron only hydrogenase large subunit-like protein
MVEVMCCEGGCIGGNATMNNQKAAKKQIDALAQNSKDIEKI